MRSRENKKQRSYPPKALSTQATGEAQPWPAQDYRPLKGQAALMLETSHTDLDTETSMIEQNMILLINLCLDF